MTLFEASTPLGFVIRVPVERWKLIVEMKHPVMAGREDDVRLALEQPDEIRMSRADESVLMFYRVEKPRRWICAVIKRVDEIDGFLITAYPTDALKEGQRIWTR